MLDKYRIFGLQLLYVYREGHEVVCFSEGPLQCCGDVLRMLVLPHELLSRGDEPSRELLVGAWGPRVQQQLPVAQGEGKGDLRFQPLHLRRTWRARASCLSLPAQLCHGPRFDDCFSGCRCTGDAASVSSPAWRYLMGRRKLETSSAARFCSGCEVFSKVSQTPLRKVLMRRQWAGAALNQCFTTKQIWAGIVFLYAVSSSWKLF